jgi:hypothetical protein
MTSIDYLIKEIQSFGINTDFLNDTLKKAKKKHKKEIKKSWYDGFRFDSKYKNFEEYYQSTLNDKTKFTNG